MKDHDSTLFQANGITVKKWREIPSRFQCGAHGWCLSQAVTGFTGNRNPQRKEEDL